MAVQRVRVGIIGAGDNTRRRHIPGLRAIPGVEITAVCNRRLESTAAVAREYGIPRFYEHWQQVVESPEVDAVLIGTWPYLHCPIALAAFERGKHVLTEARMALDAREAQRMLEASRRRPELTAQIVPSPYGLRGHNVVMELIESGFLGQPRELHVYGQNASLADPAAALSWRQDSALSGFNMLTLGILHETVSRWVAPVARVIAQVHAFIPTRIDPASGVRRPVGTPDSVQALTVHEDGLRGVYQFSGVTPLGAGMGVRIQGSEGALWYDISNERLYAGKRDRAALEEIVIPAERAREWTVEADFIDSIRTGKAVEFTPFETGVQYMEFTEAVARSAQSGMPIDLPLQDR